MKMTRKKFLRVTAGVTACVAVPWIARAQAYPVRSVRLVVGFAAGGGTDGIARLLAEWLSRHFRQQFVVENRTGMSGNFATEAVIRSPADGYTLLFTGTNSTIADSLYKKLPFDFRRDCVPVASIMRFPNLMVVSPSLPVSNVKEFIAYARSHPGELSLASSGHGTSLHLCGELFSAMTQVKMIHVPYRGSAVAYPDLIGGRVHVMFDNLTSGLEMARSGRVQGLGVTSAARWQSVPDIPAIAETVPGYEALVWYAIMAARGTPPDVVRVLNEAVSAALRDPVLRSRFAETGGVPLPMAPEALGEFINADVEKWRKVIDIAGVSAE
jgi:tripartite-type tricarboxylate transporter receptor subunit TctC